MSIQSGHESRNPIATNCAVRSDSTPRYLSGAAIRGTYDSEMQLLNVTVLAASSITTAIPLAGQSMVAES